MLADLIKQTRSCRRFYQDHRVSLETLRQLVDLARLSASAANRQPLKYILVADPEVNERIFPCLAWAGYLEDWPGPKEGERPAAYIIILGDTTLSRNFGCDHGIAAQSMLLGARETGLAGCLIGAIKKTGLREALGIPKPFEILLVMALGEPRERVVIDALAANADIRYWRDQEGVHHVPKRNLTDVVIRVFDSPTE